MTGFLLDTNVPSELTRTQSEPRVEAWLNAADDEELFLSVVSLGEIMKGLTIHPTGLLGADKAIVTSGGVALKEVDFRTMQSRLVPNLYLVGDILDIDRPSGGYSLQLCWTTGWVAGNAVGGGAVADAADKS